MENIATELSELSNLNSPRETKTCDRHGDYSAISFCGHYSPCPECSKAKAHEREQRERERQQQQIIERQLEEMGIPRRFKDIGISDINGESYREKKLVSDLKAYVANWKDNFKNGRCMVLCGGCGTGKTYKSIAMGKELINRYLARVKYYVFPKLIADIKAAFSGLTERTSEQIIEYLSNVDLLILDEISAGYGSETEKLLLFRLINNRYENCLPCVLISNCKMSELGAIIGEAALERVGEDAVFMLDCVWASRRGK